jgi:hypothetical protein
MTESTITITDDNADAIVRLRSLADLIEAGHYDHTAELSIDGDEFIYHIQAKRKAGVLFSTIAESLKVSD